eukprot:SM000165S02198  [mRNA]  locus=s165:131853:133992:+ [translate_table: standard]
MGLCGVGAGMDEPGWYSVATFRDMPYGWDTGVENLIDPSHVPVAHHNVNGGVMGKRTDAKPLPLQVGQVTPAGFTGTMPKDGAPATQHVFEAPARFTYDFQARGKPHWRGIVTTYCTPIAPGKCRIIVVNARNFMVGLSSGKEWWQLLPRWFDHQLMLNLLDGDAALLHGQERELRSAAGADAENWNNAFFMPATSDRYVGAFRNWLRRFGGGQPSWLDGISPALPPLVTNRHELLDRYNQHTRLCSACSGALAGFTKARNMLAASAMGLLVAAAVQVGSGLRLKLAAASVVAALLSAWLTQWAAEFSYRGIDHARANQCK